MVHGYTLEEYQRKGYYRLTLLNLMQQMLDIGLTPAGELLEGHVPSVKLLRDLGFVESFNSTWKQFV